MMSGRSSPFSWQPENATRAESHVSAAAPLLEGELTAHQQDSWWRHRVKHEHLWLRRPAAPTAAGASMASLGGRFAPMGVSGTLQEGGSSPSAAGVSSGADNYNRRNVNGRAFHILGRNSGRRHYAEGEVSGPLPGGGCECWAPEPDVASFLPLAVAAGQDATPYMPARPATSQTPRRPATAIVSPMATTAPPAALAQTTGTSAAWGARTAAAKPSARAEVKSASKQPQKHTSRSLPPAGAPDDCSAFEVARAQARDLERRRGFSRRRRPRARPEAQDTPWTQRSPRTSRQIACQDTLPTRSRYYASDHYGGLLHYVDFGATGKGPAAMLNAPAAM